MQLEILTDDAAGLARWRSLFERLPPGERDIHFLPEYGAIYRATHGYQPLLAVFGDERRFVMQPYVRRRLNELPFLRDQQAADTYYDLANPYGYGGPALSCDPDEDTPALLREFSERFLDYCRGERLASEFTSLHPFLAGCRELARSGLVAVEQRKEIVYMDLTASEAESWKAVRKGHKSSIGRARKGGVHVEKVAPTAPNFEELNRLYYGTMERNGADARWLFPRDYFRRCHDSLGAGRASLFFARVGAATAAACILMHDGATAYYHFSGSDERFYDLCPNNLMVFEAAAWARENGCGRFHLGGGLTSSPQDGIFVFKSGFSDRRATLYTYHRVLHQPTYDHLCEMKMRHEAALGAHPQDPDFFPLYRR